MSPKASPEDAALPKAQTGSKDLSTRSPHDEPGKPAAGKKKRKIEKEEGKGSLGSTRGIETMFRTSYRTHMDLSALADHKANIMISINGIIMSIILASIAPKIDTNPWLLMPTSVLLVGCLVAIIYAVLAARPRVSSQLITLEDVRKRKANILFFGNFVKLTEEDYVIGMTDLLRDPEAVYHNMMKDLYNLGKVLETKFALLRVSYMAFIISLTLGIVLYLLVFAGVVESQSGVGNITFG
jgi:hypothetical protein